jgi:NAD(P)-dependent dehydrogenase (short-subunit alcohol dehydrogenase family)
MNDLRDRWVLVTGAGSGIGLECARAFAAAGANIVLSDINATSLEPVRAEITARGVRCLAWPCDVASEASVQAFAAYVTSEIGAPDVLLNNAGVAYLGAFMETPLEEWRRIQDINVFGIVHCIRAFLPAMHRAGGARKIVNVASLAGFAPAPNMAAYAASKHAVVGLSEVLAMELDGTNVSVLVVCPGIINTAIVKVSPFSSTITEAQVQRLQQYYVTHGCHPDVVARDVVRAVLDDTSFLYTGPMARLGATAMRISRRLARRLTLSASRRNGYLFDGSTPK